MKKRKNSPIPYILIGVGVIALLALIVFAIIREPAGVKGKEETSVAAMQEGANGTAGETDSITADNPSVAEDSDMTGNEALESDSMQAVENDSESSDDDLSAKSGSEDFASEKDSESSSVTSAEGTVGTGADTSGEKGDSETLATGSDSSTADSGNIDSSDSDVKDTEAADSDQSSSDSESADSSDSENEDASAATSQEQTPAPTPHTGGHLVVIDPGHQSRGMSEKEPNGPGSSNMKAKVTGGTSGKTSGLTEYQLNLTVGLKLRDELSARGYTVIMTRETNEVSLSNVDRAQIANNAGAEAFIRIHANGSEDTSTNGAMTICQTPSNPYNAAFYSQSRKLSDCVLDSFVAATGCKKQYVWETDTMTGINWANVPSTIIEMGYMSNPTEDANMASEAYQSKMVTGIANGIDAFFAN